MGTGLDKRFFICRAKLNTAPGQFPKKEPFRFYYYKQSGSTSHRTCLLSFPRLDTLQWLADAIIGTPDYTRDGWRWDFTFHSDPTTSIFPQLHLILPLLQVIIT